MESLGPISADEVSEAVVVWTGWGIERRPVRDEGRLVARFGEERARNLLTLVRKLEDEFYESDARFTAADLAAMSEQAARRFARLHPELTSDAIQAFAWCYTYDFK